MSISAVERQADCVFHQARHGNIAHLRHFERVPVHVNGVGVAAVIIEQQPVAPALADREQRMPAAGSMIKKPNSPEYVLRVRSVIAIAWL
jgi:hypothetical protein